MTTATVWSRLALPICLTFSLAYGLASPILVNNPSFEPLLASDQPAQCGFGCFSTQAPIVGWTNTGISGQFKPGTDVGNFTFFSTLSDNVTSAWSNGPTISQAVGATVQLGVTYVLQVDLGERHDTPFVASADLLINGIPHVAIGTPPVPGNWSTYTATYTGLLADVGSSITIELKSAGPQANFDNVRLNDSLVSVPEPASCGTVGLALMALLVLARRQYRARTQRLEPAT
jgi:hypothetical protein